MIDRFSDALYTPTEVARPGSPELAAVDASGLHAPRVDRSGRRIRVPAARHRGDHDRPRRSAGALRGACGGVHLACDPDRADSHAADPAGLGAAGAA